MEDIVDYDAIAEQIIAGALRVHTKLGPGLLERAYEACLSYELTKRGFTVAEQVPLALTYDEIAIDVAYRLDLLVAGAVVIEVKAVEKLLPVHHAQLLSYLRLGDYHLGLLLNFNTLRLSQGIKRVINGYRIH